MKTLLIVFTLSSLSLGASAQKNGGHYGGSYHHIYRAPRVIVAPSVGFGWGYGYPYLGYPYFGYPYYGYPYPYGNPYYGSRREPYKLSLQIQSIKTDYKKQIKDVRHNKSISHAEKKKEVQNLKAERDQEIINAQINYRPDKMNNQNQDNGNNSPGNNS